MLCYTTDNFQYWLFLVQVTGMASQISGVAMVYPGSSTGPWTVPPCYHKSAHKLDLAQTKLMQICALDSHCLFLSTSSQVRTELLSCWPVLPPAFPVAPALLPLQLWVSQQSPLFLWLFHWCLYRTPQGHVELDTEGGCFTVPKYSSGFTRWNVYITRSWWTDLTGCTCVDWGAVFCFGASVPAVYFFTHFVELHIKIMPCASSQCWEFAVLVEVKVRCILVTCLV